MRGARLSLIEFPADDPERARRFWEGLLEVPLQERTAGQGSGRQTSSGGPVVGIHERGRGPGDTQSLPYFEIDDMTAALARVLELGGSHVHPGTTWSICRDSEGTPFALAATTPG
jgi:predicted enzyme related to lactoylglutathione lyase